MPRVVGRHFVALLIAVLTVIGCHGPHPVYDVQNRPIPGLGQEQPSLETMRDAITAATVKQRRQVTSVGSDSEIHSNRDRTVQRRQEEIDRQLVRASY
jgi:hypothetical protein